MRKKIFFAAFLFVISLKLFSQNHFNESDPRFLKQTYIMMGVPHITKSDSHGKPVANDAFSPSDAPYTALFRVIRVVPSIPPAQSTTLVQSTETSQTFPATQNPYNNLNPEIKYVIQFLDYKTSKNLFLSKKTYTDNLNNAAKFNFVVPSGSAAALSKTAQPSAPLKEDDILALNEEAYFTISLKDLKESGVIYNPKAKVEFSYGTITYLARLRPKTQGFAGRWSTDLSLGLVAGPRFNISENWAFTVLAGVAITKINLDSATTNNKATQTIEKPALTPNVNFMFSYRNFSFGLGLGTDWVNDDTEESKAWIYNNKLFYGISIGINVFRTNNEEGTPTGQQEN